MKIFMYTLQNGKETKKQIRGFLEGKLQHVKLKRVSVHGEVPSIIFDEYVELILQYLSTLDEGIRMQVFPTGKNTI